MNYHFNSTTIVELIHLIRGEKIYLTRIKSENNACIIPLIRKTPPNEGNYDLVIRNISEQALEYTSIPDTDVFRTADFNPVANSIIFETDSGRIRFSVTEPDVSAICKD